MLAPALGTDTLGDGMPKRHPTIRFEWDERYKRWNIYAVNAAGRVCARDVVETGAPVDDFALARFVAASAAELSSLLPYVDF